MPNVLEKCSAYCSTKVSVPLPHHLTFGSAVSGSFLSACTRAYDFTHSTTRTRTHAHRKGDWDKGSPEIESDNGYVSVSQE